MNAGADDANARDADFNDRVEREVNRRLSSLTWFLCAIPLLLGSVHFFILIFVIPKFKEMFEEMDVGALPRPTLLVIAISQLLSQYWYFVIPAYLIFVAAVYSARDRLALLTGLIFLFLAGFGFYAISLFMPLVKIMDKLSGGG